MIYVIFGGKDSTGIRGCGACGKDAAMIPCIYEAHHSIYMPTITIPKESVRYEDLVAIPREEYEAITRLRTDQFIPTAAQKKALIRAEENLKRGKTLSLKSRKKCCWFLV